MNSDKKNNRKKPKRERLIDKSVAKELLKKGLSYSEVARQIGYNKRTISTWAREPDIKKKLPAIRERLLADTKRKNRDNLPAFIEFLCKKHTDRYLDIFSIYAAYIKPKLNDKTPVLETGNAVIIKLLNEGYTQREVSRQTGTGKGTVNRIAKKFRASSNGSKNILPKNYSAVFSLSTFMVWLSKNHSYLHDQVEPIYNKYISL